MLSDPVFLFGFLFQNADVLKKRYNFSQFLSSKKIQEQSSVVFLAL